MLCTKEFAEHVDKGCPLVIGGPLEHIIAAKAVALTEANAPVVPRVCRENSREFSALAKALLAEGLTIATGGTDNHLMLVDVRPLGLTGRQAESRLRECGVTCNRNSLPFDPNGPWYTSGLRIGTPAVTTLGMDETEMKEIAAVIKAVLSGTKPEISAIGENAGKPSKAKYRIDASVKQKALSRVHALLGTFPVYPNLDLELLRKWFK